MGEHEQAGRTETEHWWEGPYYHWAMVDGELVEEEVTDAATIETFLEEMDQWEREEPEAVAAWRAILSRPPAAEEAVAPDSARRSPLDSPHAPRAGHPA